MAKTYETIATQTLGSSASSVTFNSVNQNFTDLVIVINATASGGGLNPLIEFNSDTGSNYDLQWMYGNGSSPYANRYTNQTSSYIGYMRTDQPSAIIVNVLNYSNASVKKMSLFRWNVTGNEVGFGIIKYNSNTAISTIKIKTSANDFASGSKFTIYGIKAA